MKRNYLYYLLTILFLAVSCEKDEMACTTTVETQEVSSIAATTAQCGGIISSDGNPTIKEAGVEWCTTSDFESNVSCASIAKAKLGKFACEITDLKDNTQYYVRAYARNSYGTIYGEVLSFKTLEIVLPAVLTDSVTNISPTSATVGGEVTDDGNGVVAERGVVYSTNPSPTVENNKVVCGSGKGAFTCNLTDLQDGVTYYVRAYAVNKKGTAYGEEKSFTTTAITVPTVTTASATNISSNSATVGGEVTDDGNGVIAERGVVYGTTPNPTTSNNKVVSGSGKGSFTCNLSNLQDGVTYYVRAYAVNQKGTAYGEEKAFTTMAITIPTVTTSSATSISYTSATVFGSVTDDGGATVTERGVVYSTTSNPTTSNSKVVSGSGKGSFTCNLSNLQDGVTYYVRAYAVNKKGTAYGKEKSFTTLKHEYVDLGLSVKWATCNVGANSPEEHGDYFAWGETEPKSTYIWSTYKYCNGSSRSLTKYCTNSSYGTVDNKTTLELSDDAARANWGGTWRMPTDAELTELREKCTWTWTNQNGAMGYKVTSKSNGRSIFLPAAGIRNSSDAINEAGDRGCYWSSSLYTDSQDRACLVRFFSTKVERYHYSRSLGFSIRPVCQ